MKTITTTIYSTAETPAIPTIVGSVRTTATSFQRHTQVLQGEDQQVIGMQSSWMILLSFQFIYCSQHLKNWICLMSVCVFVCAFVLFLVLLSVLALLENYPVEMFYFFAWSQTSTKTGCDS